MFQFWLYSKQKGLQLTELTARVLYGSSRPSVKQNCTVSAKCIMFNVNANGKHSYHSALLGYVCHTLRCCSLIIRDGRRRLVSDVLGSSCPRIITLVNYILRVTEHLTIHSNYKCEQQLNSLCQKVNIKLVPALTTYIYQSIHSTYQ